MNGWSLLEHNRTMRILLMDCTNKLNLRGGCWKEKKEKCLRGSRKKSKNAGVGGELKQIEKLGRKGR